MLHLESCLTGETDLLNSPPGVWNLLGLSLLSKGARVLRIYTYFLYSIALTQFFSVYFFSLF